ncbi:MAG: S8 family serine peptidase [Bacteroidia bacterium]|nr:S8 family serine peptidase [Bacteroidia bacterium]
MSVHLISILISAAAFLVLGRGVVRRGKGLSFNPLPAFLLMLAAIAFPLVSPAAGVFSRIARLLVDFGAGMVLAAAYLRAYREPSRIFWVPGLLGVVLGGLIYGLTALPAWFSGQACDHRRNDPRHAVLLVELGPDDQLSEIEPILRKYGAHAERAFPEVSLDEDEDLAQYYVVHVDTSMAQLLEMRLEKDKENVDSADPDHAVRLVEPSAGQPRASSADFLADDPYLDRQWYAAALNYNQVYEWLQAHPPVRKAKVAIVDTGVDRPHEDLNEVYAESGGEGDRDQHSHGTHCAGLAGAATNNGKGVGSLNWNGEFLTLTGYPALDASGRGSDLTVSRAIVQAAEGGADVISMSLGGPAPFGAPKAQVDAIKYARKLGAVVVVAAGNSNMDAKLFSPANIKGVIVVAAVDEQLNKAVFSNTNTSLGMPIAAPGVNIMSSVPGSQYQSYSGTSMATPIVAGLAGILKAYNPELGTKQVWELLSGTGASLPASGQTGKLIQPEAAIRSVSEAGVPLP